MKNLLKSNRFAVCIILTFFNLCNVQWRMVYPDFGMDLSNFVSMYDLS
jgi:hypothetical protein